MCAAEEAESQYPEHVVNDVVWQRSGEWENCQMMFKIKSLFWCSFRGKYKKFSVKKKKISHLICR